MHAKWFSIALLTLAGPAFAGTGKVETPFPYPFAIANAAKVDSSGRTVAVGYYSNSTQTTMGLARYLSDGTLDTSFAGNGKQGLYYGDYTVASSLDFLGSEIIVGGNNVHGAFVTCFEENGTHDKNFAGTGALYPADAGSIDAVHVNADDTILVAGTYSTEIRSLPPIVTTSGGFIDRYLPTGTIDTSFGPGGRVSFMVRSYYGDEPNMRAPRIADMEVANGQIVVVANEPSDSTHSATQNAISYSSSNGALNWQTSIPTVDTYSLSSASINTDQSVLLVGSEALIHLLSNGQFDTSFNGTGVLKVSGLGGFARVDSQGRIVVGSKTSVGNGEYAFEAQRYTSAGALDTSFNAPYGYQSVFFDPGYGSNQTGLFIDSSDRITLYGTDGANFALTRILPTGLLDTSFGTNYLVGVAPDRHVHNQAQRGHGNQ